MGAVWGRQEERRPPTAPPTRVRVVSYNLLWQPRARPERYPYAREKDLQWGRRLPLIRAELERLRGDVVLLQEVDTRTAAEELVPHGFAIELQQLRHAKADHTTGCALLYRRSLFGRVSWRRSGSRTLAVELEWAAPAAGLPPLHVLCVHLEANPARPDARVRQLARALGRVARRVQETGERAEEAALIVGGDFNSTDRGAAFELATRGRVEPGRAEAGVVASAGGEEQPFRLVSAYRGREPRFTLVPLPGGGGGMDEDPPVTIDFILCSAPALEADGAEPPCAAEEEPVLEGCGVPDRLHGSDHLAVACTVNVFPRQPSPP